MSTPPHITRPTQPALGSPEGGLTRRAPSPLLVLAPVPAAAIDVAAEARGGGKVVALTFQLRLLAAAASLTYAALELARPACPLRRELAWRISVDGERGEAFPLVLSAPSATGWSAGRLPAAIREQVAASLGHAALTLRIELPPVCAACLQPDPGDPRAARLRVAYRPARPETKAARSLTAGAPATGPSR